MAQKRNQGELEMEAEAHLTLARLLRKGRSPAKREALQRILKNDHPLRRKIAEIEALDAEVEQDETVERRQYIARRRVEPLSVPVAKLKGLIKQPRARLPLIPYLFGERQKILAFGRATHTASSPLLFSTIRVDRRFLHGFADGLKRTASELLDLVKQALLVGWRVAEKREYNLLVVLGRLCEEILAVNFSPLSHRDPGLIHKLSAIEALFLTLHHQPEDIEGIYYTLGRALTLEPSGSAAAADRVEDRARRILSSDFSAPSLYNFLLLLNMIWWRRLLTLPELYTSSLGDLINGADFACTPEVRSEIESYVAGLKESLIAIDRRRAELRKIRAFLPINEAGAPHLGPLEHFYQESSLAREESWSFSGDSDNLVLFVPRLLRLIDLTYAPLLSGRVVVESERRVAIFAAPLFGVELQKLRNFRERVERLAFDFHTLSYKRYLAIKRDGQAGIRVESAVVGYLEEIQAVLLGIGERLMRLLDLRRAPAPAGLEPHPIDAIPTAGAELLLPHEGEKIRSATALGGRSVGEALQDLTTICLLAASYLYRQDFASQPEEEASLAARFASSLDSLRRLADRASYEETVAQLLTDR